MPQDSPPLLTFGHGTADRHALATLLGRAGITSVVDVRTAPGSRRNPDVGRDALASWLPEEGIRYRWERRLGGFRRAAPDSPDTFWRNDSFRGYAGHTRSPEFLAAMEELLLGTADEPAGEHAGKRAGKRGREHARDRGRERTAVMCSESLWWRCHRRLIADHAVLVAGVPALHLAHDGRLTEHPPTPGARLRDDGLLVYDRPAG